MSDNKQEYRGHVARLAKEFSELPRVVVSTVDGHGHGVLLLGQLQILDLRQDSGYAASVMVDKMPGGETYKLVAYQPERVRLFSEYKDQLMNFIECGTVSDGALISEQQCNDLCQLGLAERVPGGWNIVTAAGVQAAIKVGWLGHS